jgi:hypothetical protein
MLTLFFSNKHNHKHKTRNTKRLPHQERSIDPSVPVSVYTSHAAAVGAGSSAGELFLGAGERVALWLGQPAEDKLPKDAKEGARGLMGVMKEGRYDLEVYDLNGCEKQRRQDVVCWCVLLLTEISNPNAQVAS